MDLAKLRAYLDNRKELSKGSSMAPDADEYVNMPEDIRKLALQGELEVAGQYTPAAQGWGFPEQIIPQINRDKAMAKELSQPELLELQKEILRRKAGY